MFSIEGQSISMREKMLLQRRMRCYFEICLLIFIYACIISRSGIFICIWIFIIIHIICLKDTCFSKTHIFIIGSMRPFHIIRWIYTKITMIIITHTEVRCNHINDKCTWMSKISFWAVSIQGSAQIIPQTYSFLFIMKFIHEILNISFVILIHDYSFTFIFIIAN